MNIRRIIPVTAVVMMSGLMAGIAVTAGSALAITPPGDDGDEGARGPFERSQKRQPRRQPGTDRVPATDKVLGSGRHEVRRPLDPSKPALVSARCR
jgi:hypothetical protein